MSDLTPESIVDWPLRTGVRGYRVDQVDELLDRVADRVEELERLLAERDAELDRVRTRLEEAAGAEETLSRTLVTAQRTAEETLAEAQDEAERITAEARDRADELVDGARREAADLRHEATREVEEARREAEVERRDAEVRLTQLKGAVVRFRAQLQDHLDAHQALLDQVPEAPDAAGDEDVPVADGPTDGDRGDPPSADEAGTDSATPLFSAAPSQPAGGPVSSDGELPGENSREDRADD